MRRLLTLRVVTVGLAVFERYFDMKTRIISGVIGIIVLLPVLYFSGTVVLPIAVAILSLIASLEMAGALGMKKRYQFLIPSLLYAAVLPMITHFVREEPKSFILYAALVTVFYMLVCFAAAVFSNGKIPFSLIAQQLLGTIYATAGLSAVAFLRILPDGAYVFGLVFVGAWVTDTMAYFTGVLLGKHKLCPAISPKKTIEGSIGGIVFCILGFILYALIMNKAFGLVPNYLVLGIAGALSSFVSQIGDLTASLIKREHGVKDFGKLMPGHGGVLDRFDSIIAVAALLVLFTMLPAGFAFFS